MLKFLFCLFRVFLEGLVFGLSWHRIWFWFGFFMLFFYIMKTQLFLRLDMGFLYL